VREICTLRAMRREPETWPRENCEPAEQSKELDWKPSPYSARQLSTLPGYILGISRGRGWGASAIGLNMKQNALECYSTVSQ